MPADRCHQNDAGTEMKPRSQNSYRTVGSKRGRKCNVFGPLPLKYKSHHPITIGNTV